MSHFPNWLVVWLPFFIFPYIGFLIIPVDELIFFRGVAQPPTSKAMCKMTRGSTVLTGESDLSAFFHRREDVEGCSPLFRPSQVNVPNWWGRLNPRMIKTPDAIHQSMGFFAYLHSWSINQLRSSKHHFEPRHSPGCCHLKRPCKAERPSCDVVFVGSLSTQL